MYRIRFNFFKRGISVVTNAKYIADFFLKELKECKVTNVDTIQSTDNGYIEKVVPSSGVGIACFPGESIQGYINYYGKEIPILQIFSFDNMQPVRVFTNYIVAKQLSEICLPIHASSISINDMAVSFMGNKNSGKSTLSISNVLWHDSKFISDDITFLFQRNDKIVADGLFNGAHVFDSEKYIYKNKMFIKNRDANEYIKRRLFFNKNYVSDEKPLHMIIINEINDTNTGFSFKRLEADQAIQKLRNNVIRFANIHYQQFDELLLLLANQCSVYVVSTGNNFIESAQQIYNLIIKEANAD